MNDPELINLDYKVISEHKAKIPWCKVILMIMILLMILITIIALIIFYMIKKKDTEKTDNNQNDKDKDKDIVKYMGEITCVYEVNSTDIEIQILSE